MVTEPTEHRKGLRILTGVLSLTFLLVGALKLLGLPLFVEGFEAWGYPAFFRHLVGIVELFGALALLHPKTASVGTVMLGSVMLGAMYTHLFRGFAPLTALPAALLFLIAFTGNRWLDRPPDMLTSRRRFEREASHPGH